MKLKGAHFLAALSFLMLFIIPETGAAEGDSGSVAFVPSCLIMKEFICCSIQFKSFCNFFAETFLIVDLISKGLDLSN